LIWVIGRSRDSPPIVRTPIPPRVSDLSYALLVIDVDRFGPVLSKMGNGVGAVSATNERRLGLNHELIALDGVKADFYRSPRSQAQSASGIGTRPAGCKSHRNSVNYRSNTSLPPHATRTASTLACSEPRPGQPFCAAHRDR